MAVMENIKDSKTTKYVLPMSHMPYDDVIETTLQKIEQMKDFPFRIVLGALLFLLARSILEIATTLSIVTKYQSKSRSTYSKMVKQVVHHTVRRNGDFRLWHITFVRKYTNSATDVGISNCLNGRGLSRVPSLL